MVLGPLVAAGRSPGVHAWRRFRPSVHLPTAGILLLGGGLAAYVAPAYPPTAVGRVPALVAASTPWLALLRGARTVRQRDSAVQPVAVRV